jgi:hypothetical protein
LLQEISKYIQNKQSPLYIHKVRTHKNILRNEEADKLAKKRAALDIVPIIEQYHNAHTSHTGYIEMSHINTVTHSKTQSKTTKTTLKKKKTIQTKRNCKKNPIHRQMDQQYRN